MKRLRSWIGNNRGAVSIECALGTVVMITASLLALDLYRLADTQATVTHSAFAVTDYTSRDGEVNALFVERLAEFLHAEQLTASDAAFIISVVHWEGEGPALAWTRKILLGPDAATDLADCSRITQGGAVTLPAGFTMRADEVVIVGEVCAELTTATGTQVLYAHYILPSRADAVPTLLEPEPELEQVELSDEEAAV